MKSATDPRARPLFPGVESTESTVLPLRRAGSAPRPVVWTHLAAMALSGTYAAVACCGCAAGPSSTERALSQLRADLARLEAEHTRVLERLTVLEATQGRDPSRHEGPRQSQPGSAAAPRLAEHTASAQARSQPVPNGGAPSAGASLEPADIGAGGNIPPDEGGPIGVRDDSSDQVSASARSPQARRMFDTAVALIRSKSYDKALETLTAFLVRYPDHPSAAHAMYLRAECFYGKADYGRASQEYQGLLARFPFCDKASDALLKLGLCREKTGQLQQAEEAFAELRQRYPNSAAARQLPRR